MQKKPLFSLGILLLHFVFFTQMQAQLPAFPSAEGFGRYTSGGRGGQLIKVTNLNDSGEGSLRAAVEASGARIVVFDISGTIQLKSQLVIRNDSITIAGQTAPGDGVCIRDYEVNVAANNVIIRYMRFRLGDETFQEADALGGRGYRNIIIDHCSTSWSVDECVSFYGNQNFTMQWCLIGESLRNSEHSKGSHGYGGIWGGEKASFHHNLLANHSSRNPRFCGSRYTNTPDLEHVDFRNNVIYNWGYNTAYGAEGGSYNLVNNYYKPGPATDDDVRSRIIHADADNGGNTQPVGVHGAFFVEGNLIVGDDKVSGDNWAGGVEWSEDLQRSDIESEVEFEAGHVNTDQAEEAYLKVIEYVGASLSRDTVDRRTIHDLVNGTATISDGGNGSSNGIIDTQEAVGGWPVLISIPAPVDSDGDGMPDEWELSRGLDPSDPADGNEDRNRDGYTNIEEYINGLAHGYFDTAPIINVLQPGKNEVFIASADTSIHVEAYANDFNGGRVVRMELYLDDELIRTYEDSSRILTTLSEPSPGMHTLMLKAADDSGQISIVSNTFYVGQNKVSISVEDSPHGQVILDPPGGIYSNGVQVKIEAIPVEGYIFHGWIGDMDSRQAVLQLETAVDLAIKPVFVKDPEKKHPWSHPVKISFQSAEEPGTIGAYLDDYGDRFDERWSGFSYGWMEGDNHNNGSNLSQSGVWKYFKSFESGGSAFSWAIALPRGKYRIRLGLGGKVLLGFPTETELKINVEGILVEDPDGADLLDEHILDSIPVLDGQLTLSSVENSRICFIEIELVELLSPRTLRVENGSGSGAYYPDLKEDILVMADKAPLGQAFDRWTGDTDHLSDIHSSATFLTMPDSDVQVSASYGPAVQDTAHYLIVVDGSGSGYYSIGTEVEVTAPLSRGEGRFSHWEYDCRQTLSIDRGSANLMLSMPNAHIVIVPVYEFPASGHGDIYQAEDALRDGASTEENYHGGYFGLGYVNFKADQGSYIQFSDIDGKQGGLFSIKLRYSLADPDREGVVIINGTRDTVVMAETTSWSDWGELEIIAAMAPGTGNTIRIETTGDDLGYLDQIEVIKRYTSHLESERTASAMNVSCFPNPFKDAATVSFELSRASDMKVQLYNLQGHRIREQSLGSFLAGIHEFSLHREDLSPGFYILRMLSDQEESMRKILIN